MLYKQSSNNKIREIILPKNLELSDRYEFIGFIEEFVNSQDDELHLNFEKTIRIDSAGMGFLLIARQHILNCHKELVLCEVQDLVMKEFIKMNFEQIFTIK